jgi:hypothetical protein
VRGVLVARSAGIGEYIRQASAPNKPRLAGTGRLWVQWTPWN